MSMTRIKVTFGNDTRLWRATDVPPQFGELDKFIFVQWGSVLPDPKERVVQYKDDEGDLISITDQQDLNDAIQMAKELGCKSLKLVIQVADRPQSYNQSAYAHSIRSDVAPYVPKIPQVDEPAMKRAKVDQPAKAAAPGAANDDTKDGGEEECLNCPGKHGLTKFTTPHQRYNCDVCGKKHLPKGSVMFGCRRCDWDACDSCATGADATMADADATAGAPAGGCTTCPMKEAAKDFIAKANEKDSAMAKEIDVAVDIMFKSLREGDSLQVAMDTILASCDTIREHKLMQLARPFIYGYVEKMQRMTPMLLSLGPDVVKKTIPQLLKAAHEMMNNKGDVYVDMAPFVRQMCPGMIEAMEANMKNGSQMDIDVGSLFGFGAAPPAAPAAVELTDTDGDKIRFALEDGKLVEYCNGKKELEVGWLKVNEFTGMIHDAGGRFTIQEAEREEKLRALKKLCDAAKVQYHVAGEPRFHHPPPADAHHHHPWGRWGHRRRHGGCGRGRGRGGRRGGRCGPPMGHPHHIPPHMMEPGAHGPPHHGPFRHHGRHHWHRHAHKWAQHCKKNWGDCAQKMGDSQSWGNWGKKMQEWGAKMSQNKDHFAAMGKEWAKKFVPKHMQKPPKSEFNMKFITHENVQQHSTFLPGQVLMKSWRVLNTGSKDWSECELIYVKGHGELLLQDTQRFPIGVVKVDEEGVVTAMINTPDKPGRYKAVFRLQKLGPNRSANGQRFGEQLFVDINVVATQEELQEAIIRQSRQQAEKDKMRRLRAEMQEKKLQAKKEILKAKAAFQATRAQKKAEIQQAKEQFHAQKRHAKAARQQDNVAARLAMLDTKMQQASLKPKKLSKLERRREALQAKLAAIEAELSKAQEDEDLDGLYSDDEEQTAGATPAAAAPVEASGDDSKDDGAAENPFTAGDDDEEDSDVFEDNEEADDLVVAGPRFDADATDAAPMPAAAEEPDAAEETPLLADPAAEEPRSDSFELVEVADAQPSAPMIDAEDVPALPAAYPFQDQLAALMGMGFNDETMVRFALDANNGDLDKSVAMILQQMGHSA